MSKSAFYGDILGDHDGRSSKGFYCCMPAILRFRSKPSDSTTIGHSFKVSKQCVDGKATSDYSISNGTSVSHKCMGGDMSSKAKITNDNINYEASYKPKDQNTPDQALSGKVSFSYVPSSGKYSGDHSFKYGSPDLGGARIWTTMGFTHNADQEFHLKPTMNVQVQDDFHLGFKADHNLSKLCSAQGILAMKNDMGDYFFKFDTKDGKNKVTVGMGMSCSEHKVDMNHDLTYDLTGETKGVMGQPITMNLAFEKAMTDAISVKVHHKVADQIHTNSSYKHKINDNMTMTVSEHLNLTNFFMDPANVNWNFGLAMKYSV